MTRQSENDEKIVIKKYPNRRLYHTHSSRYITLEDVSEMVKNGEDFTVQDAKTGEDITRQVLAQIIFEQEMYGNNLLPISFLRSIIGYYGNQMQEVLPSYLEATMEAFAQNQHRMQEYMGKAMPGFSPMSSFKQFGKQNMALFEQAFRMFSPFDNYFGKSSTVESADAEAAPSAGNSAPRRKDKR